MIKMVKEVNLAMLDKNSHALATLKQDHQEHHEQKERPER